MYSTDLYNIHYHKKLLPFWQCFWDSHTLELNFIGVVLFLRNSDSWGMNIVGVDTRQQNWTVTFVVCLLAVPMLCVS